MSSSSGGSSNSKRSSYQGRSDGLPPPIHSWRGNSGHDHHNNTYHHHNQSRPPPRDHRYFPPPRGYFPPSHDHRYLPPPRDHEDASQQRRDHERPSQSRPPHLRPPYPRTFLLSGDAGLEQDGIRQALRERGFVERTVEEASRGEGLGLIFMQGDPKSGSFIRQDSALLCALKNLISADRHRAISNKEMLYANMLRSHPLLTRRCMAETHSLLRQPSAPRSIVLARLAAVSPQIIRPVGPLACSGKGISFVSEPSQVDDAIAKVAQYRSAISSDVERDLLLWRGRKFHLRMYLLVRAASRGPQEVEFAHELWGRGKVLTAGEGYRDEDWANVNIHDTHVGTTPCNLWFPEDLPGEDPTLEAAERASARVFAHMKEATDAVAGLLRERAYELNYPESLHAFHVFGCDFLVRKDLSVCLMEINQRVGYHPTAGGDDPSLSMASGFTFSQFSAQWFEWVYRLGIEPFFSSPPASSSSSASSSTSSSSSSSPSLSGPPLTFCLLFSAGMDNRLLASCFEEKGLRPFDSFQPGHGLGVMILGGDAQRSTPSRDRRLVSHRCHVKNFINDKRKCIANKWTLFTELQQHFPDRIVARQRIAHTQKLSPSTSISNVSIVRPVGGYLACGGRGVTIVETTEQLQRVYDSLRSDKRFEMAIVSDYLMQPLLQHGKKFHLRMFLLIRPASEGHLWPRGRIVTANKAYVASDWNDPELHDTHSPSTPCNLWFPEDMEHPEACPEIFKNLTDVCQCLGSVVERSGAGPYPESRHGFHIFGLDFLVRPDHDVLLMEANDKTGLKDLGDRADATYRFTDFTRDYFDWMYLHGIKPFFPQLQQREGPVLNTFGLD